MPGEYKEVRENSEKYTILLHGLEESLMFERSARNLAFDESCLEPSQFPHDRDIHYGFSSL